MLKELKFVMGAVSKKDFIPALTHFRIENGTVRSYNGSLALCTPIPLDIDCTPRAEPLVKAIQNCTETVSMSLTPSGKLSVKSGRFKVLIDCVQEETPHVVPEGNRFDVDGENLIKALEVLSSFIGDDATRPWSNGVLLSGSSAYATNNVALVEFWVGTPFPIRCNLPRNAVKEMLRIGEAPISAQSSETSITFHYANEKWIRCQLLNTDWPDLDRILNNASHQQPIPETLYTALEVLKPFTDKLGRVYFTGGVLCTSENEGEGATYDVPEMNVDGVYAIEMLQLLNGVAHTADFTLYPKPCLFSGDRLRGALIGMRR